MKEPNDRQKLFFDLLIDCKGNVRQALLEMGNEAYSFPRAYDLMNVYGEYIRELVGNKLTLDAIKASYVLEDTMSEDGANPAAKINLDAALQILDRAGLSKQERLKIEAEAGTNIFILPPKAKEEDAD